MLFLHFICQLQILHLSGAVVKADNLTQLKMSNSNIS